MEISISVDVGGALRHLTDVQNRIPRALEQGLKDSATLYRREMMVYPPPPARMQGTYRSPVRFTTKGGTSVDFLARAPKPYKRTGTLKRSWFIGPTQRFPGGVSVRIYSSGNTAPYNVFVQKAGMQARIHAGRWPTEQSVAERLRPHFVRMIENRVSAVMR